MGYLQNDLVPEYGFNFLGGISTNGRVVRDCDTVSGLGAHETIDYQFDDHALLQVGAGAISPICADLIDFGFAVYLADRLSPREVRHDARLPENRLRRRIKVVLPVRVMQTWRQLELEEKLSAFLARTTFDQWSFEFVNRVQLSRPSESQYVLPFANDLFADAVHLNSGGLDSTLGLIELASNRAAQRIVPVTIVTNERVRITTSKLIAELRKRAGCSRKYHPVIINLSVSGGGRSLSDREPSQRGRIVLFLALGVAAALSAGTDKLFVTENGMGAIGLPLTPDQHGSRVSRAMHPKTLRDFQEIATVLLEREFTVSNLGLVETKGQLAMRLLSEEYHSAASITRSCDRASYLGLRMACGECSSCLLRRISLSAAGLEKEVDSGLSYQTDWLDPKSSWNRSTALELVAILCQAHHLGSVLCDDNSFRGLERGFPEVLQTAIAMSGSDFSSLVESKNQLVELARTHVHEVLRFAEQIGHPLNAWHDDNARFDVEERGAFEIAQIYKTSLRTS